MADKEILHWIQSALTEISLLENEKGKGILEKCGRECAKSHDLHEEAMKIRAEVKDKNDIDLLFKIYKKKVYNTSRLYKQGNTIYLEYNKCGCPIVKSGEVSNPFFCNCTKGYTKERFENLFGKPVRVELIKTMLRGDDICKQTITIMQ